MFEGITDKLTRIFSALRSRGHLTEGNIADALREIRLVLLEADVHYQVVKGFIETVRGRALGREVLDSLTPGQQVVRVVYEEMVRLLGGTRTSLTLSGSPTVVMLAGLQGSGKTTTVAKLARLLKHEGRHPLVVAADLQRPAAREQLAILGDSIGVPVIAEEGGGDPISLCERGVREARQKGWNPVLLDTAGRLPGDETLMAELSAIRDRVQPQEILLVVDAMTGQDAVPSASRFHQVLTLTGLILTKLDGDARGGAALSLRFVTGLPILYVGMGEKVEALEPFHPDRMASRILGLGDVLTLAEKAEQVVSAGKAAELERKIRKSRFTLEDFREQLKGMRSLGPLDQLLDMVPGASQLKGRGVANFDEREVVRMGAIVDSMTVRERRNPEILNGERRKRIARGSGTTVVDVNRLLRQFTQTQRVMKEILAPGAGRLHGGLRARQGR